MLDIVGSVFSRVSTGRRTGGAATWIRHNAPVLSREQRDPVTVAELLAEARARLSRLAPADALAATRAGAALIDIRPVDQRDRDGLLPGAHVIARNALEWRLDPRCEHRDPVAADGHRQVIVICDEGYQSSLAAATLRRFGLDATDVVGGVQAWRAEGLPLTRSTER